MVKQTIKVVMETIILIIFFSLFIANGWGNLSDVKANAANVFRTNGFKVIGYEGYNWGARIGSYGGAAVYYLLEKDNIIYEAALQKWGAEYHIYNIVALNAIGPYNK